MFDPIVEVCKEIHQELVNMYWVLLPLVFLLSLLLEFFKFPEGKVNVSLLLKRTVISILLLLTFEETMQVIAGLSDGIAEKIGGMEDLWSAVQKAGVRFEKQENDWFAFREWVIWIINLLSYIIAYIGVWVSQALIKFSWLILYVVSPLMILTYVSERLSFVTSSLYKGLISVAVWKVIAALLGVMLLRLMTAQHDNWDNFVMNVVINLFIGISMLFIPNTSKSLISNGLSGAASAASGAASAMIGGVVMNGVKHFSRRAGPVISNRGAEAAKSGLREVRRAFPKSREFVKSAPSKARKGMAGAHEAISKEAKAVYRSYADLGRKTGKIK